MSTAAPTSPGTTAEQTTTVDAPSPGELPTAPGGESVGSPGADVARQAWRILSPLVVSGVVAVIIWWGFLKAFSISPLVGKTPAAVWTYLVSGSGASGHRSLVLGPLGTTLRDAGVGFVAGMAAAIVVALVFVLSRSVEQALLPVSMILRSVPLVAMTPLIGLIFGRTVGLVVMGGIVVFFPAMVNIVQGLRSVHSQTRDLVVAYGGSARTVLFKVGLPTALPALFAAARISVPGALIGALVSEWLLTGHGTGGDINHAIGAFDYDRLWADIVALTATSVLIYTVVAAIENAVLLRFAPHRAAR